MNTHKLNQLRKAQRRRALAASRGLTLIEILVVLAIIGLIVGGVAVAAFGQFSQSQEKVAGNDVVALENAAEMYMVQNGGKCPKDQQDLKAGGVIKKVKKDPWGTKYQIKCPGEHGDLDVMSAGPDREFDSKDDIVSWDTESEEEDK